jgi:hypothetical protein
MGEFEPELRATAEILTSHEVQESERRSDVLRNLKKRMQGKSCFHLRILDEACVRGA